MVGGAQTPRRVRRLIVLNAPHPVAGRRFAKRHWRQLLRSWYIFFFQIPGLPERVLSLGKYALLRLAMTQSAPPHLFTDAELRRYRKAWSERGALTAMLNWYRAFRRFRAGATDLIVRQPTLILWGDRDLYLDSRLAKASLAVLRGRPHLSRRGRIALAPSRGPGARGGGDYRLSGGGGAPLRAAYRHLIS